MDYKTLGATGCSQPVPLRITLVEAKLQHMKTHLESEPMSCPRILDDEAFKCLRSGELDAFARYARNGRKLDFSGADFRGTDLRRADLSNVVLEGAYLKDADLRGVDLRDHDLEGCSLHNAKIGGTYFPATLPASEIMMSVQFGTRIRTSGERS